MEPGLIEQPGYILIDSWAGRHAVSATLIGETPKRYRIRLEEDARLPGGRNMKAGDVTLIPKDVWNASPVAS